MIILDKPYVSPLLAQTLKELNIPVFQSGTVQIPYKEELRFINDYELFQTLTDDSPRILCNSEYGLRILEKDFLPLSSQVSAFKNKLMFRKEMKQFYPHFYFREMDAKELESANLDDIPFPIIIKPIVGYASMGVFKIENAEEWKSFIHMIKNSVQTSTSVFPSSVINSTSFLLEEWIEGEEFAIDAYFTSQGEPVILSIFKRLFKNNRDTADGIYYTSKSVIQEVKESVETFLQVVGTKYSLKSFPLHFEIRLKKDGAIVPIEINPLRFAGIGTTELGYYAFNINPYEYFFLEKKPDWDKILSTPSDEIFSFYCAELPNDITYSDVQSINHEGLKSQFLNILDYRVTFCEHDITFAVVFYKSDSFHENQKIIQLDMNEFIETKKVAEVLS